MKNNQYNALIKNVRQDLLDVHTDTEPTVSPCTTIKSTPAEVEAFLTKEFSGKLEPVTQKKKNVYTLRGQVVGKPNKEPGSSLYRDAWAVRV